MSTSYLLVDGENIDATLGNSILGRRPHPEERPRWDRLLSFVQDTWGNPAKGLFFLNASSGLPMSFVQALRALGYTPVPLSGSAEEKIVDIAIQRTLDALAEQFESLRQLLNELREHLNLLWGCRGDHRVVWCVTKEHLK